MRVAFISSILAYPWGGADSLWTSAAEAVAADESNQLFLALSPKTIRHARIRALINQGAKLAVRYRHANLGSRRWKLLQDGLQLLGRLPLVERLNRFQPSVLCLCQGGTGDFLVEPDLVAWIEKSSIPYVVICQSNQEDILISPEDRTIGRHFLTHAHAVVFVSRHNRLLAESQFETALPNAVVIQNPPPRRLWPELPWPPDPQIRFATVSRLECQDKGLDMLIPALAQALGHESNWVLDLYGRGADEKALQLMAEKYQIASKISFRGFVSDVSSIWRDHHMMLLPSRVEGCSLAMMEATLCGRPVLANPVGGVDEWLVDGESGFISPEISQNALAATLRRAWLNRSSWPAMGVTAKESATRLLDAEPDKKLIALFTTAKGRSA